MTNLEDVQSDRILICRVDLDDIGEGAAVEEVRDDAVEIDPEGIGAAFKLPFAWLRAAFQAGDRCVQLYHLW